MQNISNKFSRNKIENEKNDIYMEIENAQIKNDIWKNKKWNNNRR